MGLGDELGRWWTVGSVKDAFSVRDIICRCLRVGLTDEDILPLEPRFSNGLADFCLVLVRHGRIDMSVE